MPRFAEVLDALTAALTERIAASPPSLHRDPFAAVVAAFLGQHLDRRRVDQALSSFNRLQSDTARRVLSFFRTRVKKPLEPTIPPAVAVNG